MLGATWAWREKLPAFKDIGPPTQLLWEWVGDPDYLEVRAPKTDFNKKTSVFCLPFASLVSIFLISLFTHQALYHCLHNFQWGWSSTMVQYYCNIIATRGFNTIATRVQYHCHANSILLPPGFNIIARKSSCRPTPSCTFLISCSTNMEKCSFTNFWF